MSTLQKVACSKALDSWRCAIRDIRDICEKARRSGSGVEFGTLPLIGAKLHFQNLLIVGKIMRF